MLTPEESSQALARLFQVRRVADLKALCGALKTGSRMSAFRRLNTLGYFSSYSHAGRFYTLKDIPAFDDDGLWQHQGVCFSRLGSLKATVRAWIPASVAGYTHQELHARLHVRVHNTLLDLFRQKAIGREVVERELVYVSIENARAQLQLAARRGRQDVPVAATAVSRSQVAIEVLVEVIHAASVKLSPAQVAARLTARGVGVTVDDVAAVYSQYELGKKTLVSRSRRWRR